MSEIVIGVACHKPSELPDNEIYMPIHVGSACTDRVLPGLQRDDQGDNISEKNPNYCELTAQYWLWKNVEADYYGLCHYRRFMSFAPQRFSNYTKDNRKQVSVNALNDWSKEKYCLNDSRAMRAMIEEYDVVATEEQDLSKVFTPRGKKQTVYDHFAAHDRDLINVNDLDALLALVEDKYPQIFPDLKEYLSNKYFRGFNCFVMKKELFFQLCEFEFSVLSELEKCVDLTNYDTTKTRIYGFMAEILYSGFLYHLKKQNRARIKDVQMLYFQDTDPIESFAPIDHAQAICINAVDAQPFVLDVTLNSFYERMDRGVKYDLLVLSNTITSFYKKHYAQEAEAYENITLRFAEWEHVVGEIADRNEQAILAPQLYVPWIFKHHDRMLLMGWNSLCNADCSPIYSFNLGENYVAAPRDLVSVSEANNIYGEREEYLKGTLKLDSVWNYFDRTVMLMDLRKIRQDFTLDRMMELSRPVQKIAMNESVNCIFNGKAVMLPQRYVSSTSTNPLYQFLIQDAPKWLFDEYQESKESCILTVYDPDDPWWPAGVEFDDAFWGYARKSSFFPSFVAKMTDEHVSSKGKRKSRDSWRRRIDKVLPQGTKRRALAKGAISPKQYRALHSLYSRISAR